MPHDNDVHPLVGLDRRLSDAIACLTDVVTRHSPTAFATSFSAEDMVVLDLIAELGSPVSVFTLDTGRLPEETHALMERVRVHYGRPVRILHPDAERLEAFTREEGSNAFYRSAELRRQCCEIRKVEPLRRALQGCRSWITGLRREQAVTRTALQALERDETHGLMKCNPLVDWSEQEVWAYIRARGVPYNPLHDRGYSSIGCAPCTRAVTVGEDARSGRWWWERPEHTECGLHCDADGRLGARATSHALESTPETV